MELGPSGSCQARYRGSPAVSPGLQGPAQQVYWRLKRSRRGAGCSVQEGEGTPMPSALQLPCCVSTFDIDGVRRGLLN